MFYDPIVCVEACIPIQSPFSVFSGYMKDSFVFIKGKYYFLLLNFLFTFLRFLKSLKRYWRFLLVKRKFSRYIFRI